MQDWNNDIERYRSGKMTRSEMHALERKALSDPFLADALEGAEEITSDDFAKDIASLNEKILSTEKKTIWIPLRIAAGVLILIGVSLIFYFLSDDDKSKELLTSNPKGKITDSIPASPSADTVTTKPDLLTLNEPDEVESKEKSKEEALKTSKPEQRTSAEPTFALKQTDTEAAPQPAPILLPEPVLAEKKEEAPLVKTGVEASRKLTLAEEEKEDESALRSALRDETEKDARKKSSSPSALYAETLLKNRIVTGKVTAAEDGSALPGVNVIIKGTTRGTITDEEGNYRIELGAEKNPELSFTFIGTTTNEVPVNNQSNIDTQLATDVSQLSEVVVVGYGTDNGAAADDDFPTLLIAEPNGGRRAFKKYLETNIHYPQQALENKIEGKVTVQFTVTTDGVLNEFKVIKGIGSGCDEEVIRLIKQGPKWYPSRKGELAVDSRMRVRMRFRLP